PTWPPPNAPPRLGTNGPSTDKGPCLAVTSEEHFWNSWRSWRSDPPPLSPATKIGIDNVLAPCYYGSASITQRGNNRRVKDDDQNNPGVGEGSAWILRPARTPERRSVLGREKERSAVDPGPVLQSTRRRRNSAGRLEISIYR